MSHRVLIFSAAELRGKIIEKVLSRNGFECLIFNRILEAAGAISGHAPKVVIFDTEGCFPEEIHHLRKICGTLKHTVAVVIGGAMVIEGFGGHFTRKILCLADPLDPELICEKVRETILRKKRCIGSETLEKTLKRFLNLP